TGANQISLDAEESPVLVGSIFAPVGPNRQAADSGHQLIGVVLAEPCLCQELGLVVRRARDEQVSRQLFLGNDGVVGDSHAVDPESTPVRAEPSTPGFLGFYPPLNLSSNSPVLT